MNEKILLEKLEKGEYDISKQTFKQGVITWEFSICQGIPQKVRKGKRIQAFLYQSKEEKLLFLKRYGCLPELFLDHEEVMHYSLHYYQQKGEIYEKNISHCRIR
ncbi:MAG: hypothetical protein Q4C49_04350 [Bacillota bacterium]|nr:hypothetical protein [Bacillota bacterium]